MICPICEKDGGEGSGRQTHHLEQRKSRLGRLARRLAGAVSMRKGATILPHLFSSWTVIQSNPLKTAQKYGIIHSVFLRQRDSGANPCCMEVSHEGSL